jgi:signal transduction histidine kinase
MAPKLTLATPWSRWAWRHWLAAIGVLLVIGLAPLGWIQWQQLRLLNKVATNLYDPIQWYTYQMERELSRLEHAVTLARLDPAAADPQALHLRFEVFLSRAKMFTGPQPSAQLDNSNTHARVIAQLRDFGALADPLFAEPEKLLASPQQLALLDGRIRAMLPTLAEFTREANSIGARFLEQQNNQLRKQSVLVITLAAIQAAAMLGFVGLLVLHLQRQQQRYRELQALTSALEEARDQAEAANQSKTVFLANMSHEIRTPFQGLLGMLALLGESNLNQRQRDHLKTAHNSATHLLGVLNDVLDVATMASGTLRLMVAPVSLHSVVQAVDELMQIAARDKGLKLSVDAAGDLPEWVMADATRLRQMLYNLISNAIKFTSEGSVMVTLERAEPGQPSLVVKVLDTGIGMN